MQIWPHIAQLLACRPQIGGICAVRFAMQHRGRLGPVIGLSWGEEEAGECACAERSAGPRLEPKTPYLAGVVQCPVGLPI